MYYFINDVAGVGDRLVPTGSNNLYDTQHISDLRIQQTTGIGGQPCFDVWDKSGTFYEIGCTSTSLQYWTDSSGSRHNYQWDVDRIVAPNEGPYASAYRLMLVTYVQDSVTTNGHTTIRDAGMQQLISGTGSTTSAITTVVGTVDFFYHGPGAFSSQSGDSSVTQTWITAYGTNAHCASSPPASTTLRCDDPLDDGSEKAPLVMSTLTLDKVASYVGSDAGAAPSYEVASYQLSYSSDAPFVACTDPLTSAQEYCAGEHLLSQITPTVYQGNVGHMLHATVFGYTGLLTNTYYDSTEPKSGANYQAQNSWQYLTFYEDLSTGIGEKITWQIAYSNTDGTPDDTTGQGTIDGRYDPLHCATWHDCTDNYAHPDNHAWSEEVVTSLSTLGSDSSALAVATTTYNYLLAKTGTYQSGSAYCYPTSGDSDCVGDNWLPTGDSDWQDYYHGEYQGFAQVWISSPSNDLTIDHYYSTEGWYTPWSDYQNFQGGFLYEEDRYSGNSATSSALLTLTQDTYADQSNACRSTTPTYPACEIVLQSTRTTDEELTGSTSPYAETDDTYDDYLVEFGLGPGYHNLTQQTTYGSNFPEYTRKWSYTTNDQTVGSWVYYTVNTVTHSEVDDSTSHVYQCQNITYDENAPAGTKVPSEGLPTTITGYSTCANQSGAITTYQGYDQYGNPVTSVDGVAVANSSLYSSNGCTLATAPVIKSSAWTNTHYTNCLTYDTTYNTLPQAATDALGQTTQEGYTTEDLLTSVTDANNQITTETYSYDGSGNLTTQVSEPGETNSYTTQSLTTSSCTTSSVTPCAELDTNPYLYNTVHTSTFTDSLGRTVETRTPGPGSGYDTIVMTAYNDQAHTSWQSVPFEVTHGSGWVDPNNVKDYQGIAPGGTTTFYDALGRAIAQDDPNFGSPQEPGYACSIPLSGNFTTCTNYDLGSPNGSSQTYLEALTEDPNQHVVERYLDALGRTDSTQTDSGITNIGIGLTLAQQTSYQYTVLNEVTQVQMTDEAPQSGQSITSVTTTAQYDDLGRLTQLSDPDRGTHTYTYDNDGNIIADVSGTRTIGSSYDLLGRLGCVQDLLPTQSVSGACTSGAHKYIVNTYDTSQLGTQGSTDFPVGRLTESIATTYYSTTTYAKVAETYQHDQRGQLIDEQMSFLNLPNAWNVTSALPTYKLQEQFNDAGQLVTTTTSTKPTGQGYTSTQTFDPTTGVLTGLTAGTATLATLLYDSRSQLDTIAFQSSSGSALMNDQFGYDANLRPTSTTASWQSGSGNSGTAYSQSRTYDPASNLISLTTTLPVVPGVSGSGGSMTENFCYNEQNELVWAGNSGTQPAAGAGTCGGGTLTNILTGASYHSSYVYTDLGQLWQGPLAGSSTQYQYLYCTSSQPHQLTGLYSTSATCSNKSGQGYKSSYDAWGNVTSRTYASQTATLSYDLLDHLTQWSVSSSNQEQYAYDASGTRILRRSTNGSTTTITVYAFGLEDHLYTSSGTNQANTYYYSLAGHLIGALDSSGTTFYLTDALGSLLTSFTNTAGSAQVKGEQDYAPYGPSRYSQGSINTPKGYTGQYTDSLTGLDYYGARYYDSVVGVFLSADKVQGNPQGLNPYGYVGGNPETWSDPTGHLEIREGDFIDGGGEADPFASLGGGGADTTGAGLMTPDDLNAVDVYIPDTLSVQVGDQTISQISPTEDQIVTANADGSQMTTFVDQGAVGYEQAQAELDQGYDPYGVRAEPKVVEEPTGEEGNTTSNESSNTTKVYRVQGGTTQSGQPGSKFRLVVTPDGNIQIRGTDMLHLNFGDAERANWWLQNRGAGSELVTFDMNDGFLNDLRELAVKQGYARDFPGFPQIDDPKFADQYGIPYDMFEWLLESIIPGSAQVSSFFEVSP
jgi:RHS repeat-associated protein